MKIVLFLLDALRYDTFRQCMPFLEDYAEGCLDYENCISGGPYTKASLPWLLQGKETWEPEKPNLVSILRERNYQTAAIYSTPVLNDYAPVFDMALDVFELEHGPRLAALRKKYKGSKVWGTFRNMILGRGYLRAETMNKYAKTYLGQAPDDSFTWVHYMDTHIPWNAPNLGLSNSMEAEALNKKMRDAKWTTEGFSQDEITKIQAQYRMEAFYLDECLREILPGLDDYLVIVTSDHGDLLGEYGKFSHPGLRVPELVHVPLLIKLPGFAPKKMPMLYTHYQLFEFIKHLTRIRK